jgi:hypothetical protein
MSTFTSTKNSAPLESTGAETSVEGFRLNLSESIIIHQSSSATMETSTEAGEDDLENELERSEVISESEREDGEMEEYVHILQPEKE